MLLTRSLTAVVVIAAGIAATARGSLRQAPPTEIYLAGVSDSGLTSLVNISNSPGYDNQPSFLPDSSAVLFSSERGGNPTDIYRYDIAAKTVTQVTRTPEAEYSPTVTPDRRTFSVVRVEADKTQRLWRFNLDGSNPQLVLENVKPVGYHAWIDATHLALFVLGPPATLQIADTTTGKAEIVANDIGRMVLVRPRAGTVIFTTMGPKARVINEFDLKTRTAKHLTAALDGSQEAAWTPGGRLLMGRGSVISMWSDTAPDSWTPFLDLTRVAAGMPQVTNITRLAASPDGKWIAIVGEPAK